MTGLFADALTGVLGTLADLSVEPVKVVVDGQSPVADPLVTITFARPTELAAYAAADKAKVEVVDKTVPLGHYEHSAVYDRPGRRMLLLCRVFSHSPDWPGVA